MASAVSPEVTGKLKTIQILIGVIRGRMRRSAIAIDRKLIHEYLDLNVPFPKDYCSVVTTILDFADNLNRAITHRRLMKVATEAVDLSKVDCKEKYIEMVDKLFPKKKISFARLCAAIIYTSEIILQAIQQRHHMDLITEIISWCTEIFLYHFFEAWIDAKGGWEAVTDSACGLDRSAESRAAAKLDLEHVVNVKQEMDRESRSPYLLGRREPEAKMEDEIAAAFQKLALESETDAGKREPQKVVVEVPRPRHRTVSDSSQRQQLRTSSDSSQSAVTEGALKDLSKKVGGRKQRIRSIEQWIQEQNERLEEDQQSEDDDEIFR